MSIVIDRAILSADADEYLYRIGSDSVATAADAVLAVARGADFPKLKKNDLIIATEGTDGPCVAIGRAISARPLAMLVGTSDGVFDARGNSHAWKEITLGRDPPNGPIGQWAELPEYHELFGLRRASERHNSRIATLRAYTWPRRSVLTRASVSIALKTMAGMEYIPKKSQDAVSALMAYANGERDRDRMQAAASALASAAAAAGEPPRRHALMCAQRASACASFSMRKDDPNVRICTWESFSHAALSVEASTTDGGRFFREKILKVYADTVSLIPMPDIALGRIIKGFADRVSG